MLTCSLVTRLEQAMAVRLIRNDCRQFFTNFTGRITPTMQWYWFYNRYAPSLEKGIHAPFRLFLFEVENKAVAYGAVSLEASTQHLLVTEGVAETARGKGYGRQVLAHLIALAQQENRALVADVWANNEASMALHTRAGFVLDSTKLCKGMPLNSYVLRPTKH